MKQLLSPTGFAFEEDFFIKDNVRQMVVDRFLLVVTAVKDCFEQLVTLRAKRRPHRLNINESDTGSVNSSVTEGEWFSRRK